MQLGRRGVLIVGAIAGALIWGVALPSVAATERPAGGSAGGSAGGGEAPVIVASPDGTSTACTPAEPCSLYEAQAVARRLAPEMRSNIYVALDNGVYDLSRPFALTSSDSGTHGFQVVYLAAPGAHPVLSGGRAVAGWRRVSGTSNTWFATVPPSFDTRQLYVNGQSAPLAQGLPASTGFLQTSTGFITTSTVMDGWADPTNIAAVFTGGNGAWTQTFCNVASIQGAVVTMAEPCWQNLHLKGLGVQELSWLDDPMGGFGGLSPLSMPTFLENAYELLTPGHWSIDRVTHRIYYMAPAGQDPNDESVIAPGLQTLLSATGSLSDPVHDVTIEGIQFSYGGWTAPDSDNGFAEMQADWTLTGPDASSTQGACQYAAPAGTCPFASWTRTPANVVLQATHDVTIEGDTFIHLGGAGLDIDYGSQNDLVEGNEFADISASAIQLGSTDDPLPADVGAGANEIVSGNTIIDNYIHDVANQYLGGVGIWIGYTQHTLVSHNQIDDVPYTGISIGWGGWHANVTDPGSDPNINADNVIADNVLYDYMTTLGDGGAIYSNGSQATNWAQALQIYGNVAYDGANTDFSIYTDAASQYVKIGGNFVYDEPLDSFDSGGCHTVGHIRLSGNYFAQGGPVYPCFLYTDVNTTDNATVCEDPTPAQTPDSIVSAAGIQPAERSLLERSTPQVNMVGPSEVGLGGGQVLISGSGFGPGSVVRFGSARAVATEVLSGNFILATAPGGSGTVDVTVSTPEGTSERTASSALTYEVLPLPCVPYLGGGITTALVTG